MVEGCVRVVRYVRMRSVRSCSLFCTHDSRHERLVATVHAQELRSRSPAYSVHLNRNLIQSIFANLKVPLRRRPIFFLSLPRSILVRRWVILSLHGASRRIFTGIAELFRGSQLNFCIWIHLHLSMGSQAGKRNRHMGYSRIVFFLGLGPTGFGSFGARGLLRA